MKLQRNSSIFEVESLVPKKQQRNGSKLKILYSKTWTGWNESGQFGSLQFYTLRVAKRPPPPALRICGANNGHLI